MPTASPETTSRKLLTISIAAYNVAPYIVKAIESCITDRIGNLDIIVVSDGSTDGTAELALAVARRHPDSIRVVSKANGGYGSTVNTAIGLARGTYFRLLDGDDWFSPTGLDSLLAILESETADLVLTPYVFDDGTHRHLQDDASALRTGLHDFAKSQLSARISMHSATFRTSLLTDSGLSLPEHCLYTDTLFVTTPLSLVSTVHASHVPLYQYRVCRDGQSMERKGLLAHQDDLEKVTVRLSDIARNAETSTPAHSITRAWLVNNGVLLYNLCFASPCSTDFAGQRTRIETLLKDSGIHASVLARSRVARFFSRLPRCALRPASFAYRMLLKVREIATRISLRKGAAA